MKRSENGMVIPFEKFAWDNSKSKLVIKLPSKAIENPLLLHIEFSKNSERFYLGEEKAIRQITENPDLIPKHKGSVLMLSEKRPLGSLLMDSYDFATNHLSEVTNIFRSMLHSIDSGNSEKASDYKMLEKLWLEGNTFQRIVINYLFCKFYQVKHLAANGTAGIFALTAERRREMYSELEQGMEQEFDLLAHNPTTLSELKQLCYYKRTDLTEKIFCPTLAEFYIQYISYLSDRNLFFRVCPRCGNPFFTNTSRRRYHNECARLQDKDNKLAVSTNLNAIIFTNSAKRNDTATTIFGGVRHLSEAAKKCNPSTSRSLRNLKRSWQSRKRNCRAITLQRAGQR